MNYELIYRIRHYHELVLAKTRKVQEAERILQEEQANYKNAIITISKIPMGDLLFTQEYCRADGIPHHVYHLKHKFNGNKHADNKCIFCGSANVDDFY